MHLSVHSGTIYRSQDKEATKMSIGRGMDKEHVVHIYKGMLLSRKTKWKNAICHHRDGLGDDHTKWNKSEKKQISYITYVCNLKVNDTKELIYKTEINSQT